MSTENTNTSQVEVPAADTQAQVAMYQELNSPEPEQDEPEIPFLSNSTKSFWD